MLTFKNFNIADWFSFYRIFAAPFLLILMWFDERLLFTWLLLISYSTDAIDGYLARKLNITSPRGSQLDSLGDQVTLVVGLVGLYYFETEFIRTNLVLIIIQYEEQVGLVIKDVLIMISNELQAVVVIGNKK